MLRPIRLWPTVAGAIAIGRKPSNSYRQPSGWVSAQARNRVWLHESQSICRAATVMTLRPHIAATPCNEQGHSMHPRSLSPHACNLMRRGGAANPRVGKPHTAVHEQQGASDVGGMV